MMLNQLINVASLEPQFLHKMLSSHFHPASQITPTALAWKKITATPEDAA